MNRCARCGEPAQETAHERHWCERCLFHIDEARWNARFMCIAILKKLGKWPTREEGS